jgi:hypothetical protein
LPDERVGDANTVVGVAEADLLGGELPDDSLGGRNRQCQRSRPRRGGLLAGLGAELLVQHFDQPVVLGERCGPFATFDVHPHRGDVGCLVSRVECQELGPSPPCPQQLTVKVGDVLASELRPGFVSVVRQQLTRVQGECRVDRFGGRRAVECSRCRCLERDDVDPELTTGEQHDRVASSLQPVGRDRSAGEVHRLVQPSGGVGHRHVRPQPIDHLFAMQPSVRREGKQLDEVGGRPAPPVRRIDDGTIDAHGKVAEENDLIANRAHGRVLPPTRTCLSEGDATELEGAKQ